MPITRELVPLLSFSIHGTTVLPRARIAAISPLDEILSRVRDASNWDGQTGKHPLLADAMPGGSLAYAPERNSDVYAGFEPRIVPENITLLAKTTTQTNGGNAWGERTIVLKKGDSVSANLRELGATPEDIRTLRPGSILNGGGGWPGHRKNASVEDWVELADQLHDMSMNTSRGVPAIPII